MANPAPGAQWNVPENVHRAPAPKTSSVGTVELGIEKGSAASLCLLQEYDLSKATFVKVVPTPNNGSTELVALHRDEVGRPPAGPPRSGLGWDSEALTPPGQGPLP